MLRVFALWVAVLVASVLYLRQARADDIVLGYRLEASICLGVGCHRVPTRGTLMGQFTCEAMLSPARKRVANLAARLVGLNDQNTVKVRCVRVVGERNA